MPKLGLELLNFPQPCHLHLDSVRGIAASAANALFFLGDMHLLHLDNLP